MKIRVCNIFHVFEMVPVLPKLQFSDLFQGLDVVFSQRNFWNDNASLNANSSK